MPCFIRANQNRAVSAARNNHLLCNTVTHQLPGKRGRISNSREFATCKLLCFLDIHTKQIDGLMLCVGQVSKGWSRRIHDQPRIPTFDMARQY